MPLTKPSSLYCIVPSLRHCRYCHGRIRRTVYPSGKAESASEYSQRVYCSPNCRRAHARKACRATMRKRKWMTIKYVPLEVSDVRKAV